MLGRVILFGFCFHNGKLMVDPTNPLISLAYSFMKSQFYGESSAMLWSYFCRDRSYNGGFAGNFQKTCLDKWE